MTFAKVFTSPCSAPPEPGELAGFGAEAETEPILTWWNGTMVNTRGCDVAEILHERSDWQLFRDGCPGGESPAQIGERADRVVERVRVVPGNVLLFPAAFHSVLAARWLALSPGSAGRYFVLSPASLSALVMSTIFPSRWPTSGTTIITGRVNRPGC